MNDIIEKFMGNLLAYFNLILINQYQLIYI